MITRKLIKFLVLSSFMLLALALALFSCEAPECKHENLIFEIVDPTHNDCGYTEYSCPDCNYAYVEQYRDPIPHSYNKTVTEPTCTKEGSTLYKCECGHSYISDIKAPLGHSYKKTIKNPSCTEGGSTKYTCKRCNESYVSDLTDATGHTLTNTVVEPTCTAEGYTHNECSCGYSYNDQYTNPLDHSFEESITSPSCTGQGYTTYTCGCGYTFKADYTEPLPHTFNERVTLPTCTSEGYTTFICDCGYSFSDTYTAPTGHNFLPEVISERSCTDTGETKYTCSCGEVYSITVAPLGHTYTRSVTMPTLSDMGYTVYTCETCEHTYTGEFTFYSEIVPDGYANNTDVLAKGIDISYHNYTRDANGNYISLDWESIKNAGISYVIIRIADAAVGIDPTFEKSYTEAKEAGLDVGFYFYTRATNPEEITLEANLVISALEGKTFEYPVYLDLEDDSQKDLGAPTLNKMCVTFFTALQRAGYYTGLYVNDEWLYTVIDTDTALSSFDIWYARHPSISQGESAVWDQETYGAPLGMWQYTDSGIIDGNDNTEFDFNYCYKDYPSIIKEYGFNGYESDFNHIDSNKSFVWVIYEPSIKIRSSADYFTTDGYDPNLDVVGYAPYCSRFEVVDANEFYTVIKYNGEIAYISAKSEYVSFEGLYDP